MNHFKIGIVVGSLRKESYNKQTANALVKLFPKEFTYEFIDIGNLPLYNQDDDNDTPPTVISFKQRVKECQGIIFVTPEYNRSIPGVLKNALDQASRPYGMNAWDKIPAGIIGVSIGNISTAIAQQHLRNSLSFLNMPTLNQPECYLKWYDGMVEDGEFSEKTARFMQNWVDAYVAFVKQNNQ
ncbi:NAD(P)H-dependent oxidoreductase [Proteus mirabilis]|uniref:NADPH-dependent FMN reductase n=1 Tax=Proteus TaxID=583 RepID=UPI000DFA8CCB|nr:NAD(P)H-dependent oxidoreductase [Proteus vulgaris]MBG3081909.1 NAD(P)H-dependent oxidoreductase [Proteus mirabilis]QPN88222.1 NAD(P)H-dependent oxidoreductase [Proteus vulgaris]SUC18594.1 chromate reductase (NADPH-dependent FMN reductase) [Proteus vulgaris]